MIDTMMLSLLIENENRENAEDGYGCDTETRKKRLYTIACCIVA